MISFTAVLTRLPGLDAERLQLWITQEWVRPQLRNGEAVFQEIDIARLHLILDLQETMEVGEGAMPIVLSLLDQLHETRRQMRRLCEALNAGGASETAEDIVRRLAR